MRRIPGPLFSLALVTILGGCAAAHDYPSLERRPAELRSPAGEALAGGTTDGQTGGRQTGSGQPVSPEAPPPSPAPPSADLSARLGQLVDQANSAHQRFEAKRPLAQRSVASAGRATPGSEAWSMATVALSDLESARSDAMVALAELDQLYTEEAIAASQSGNPASIDAITAARDRVTALVTIEDDVLAGLRGRLGG